MKSKNCLFLLLALGFCQVQAQWSLIDSLARGNFQSTHFINADTGFTYHEYGTLRRTVDGGQTWDSIAIPFEGFVNDFAFPTPTVGYLVGGAWFPFGQYYANAILKTTDGGLTWDSIMGDYRFGLFNHIQALNTTEYYTVGGQLILHSHDGGLTHDTLTIPAAGNAEYLKAHFASAATGYILTNGYFSGTQTITNLYKTSNSGQSWQSVFADTSSWSAGDFVLSPFGEIFLTGRPGGMVYSANGGQSWQNLPFTDTLMVITKLQMVGGTLYGIGRDSSQNSNIFSSTDQGQSWQTMVSTQASFNGFLDFSFPTANAGYAITNNQVYKNAKLISLNEAEHRGFELYPNPASTAVTLQLANSAKAEVILYNSLGQKVAAYSNNGNQKIEIEVSSLKAGLYLLEVVQAGERFNRRLIKQ